MMDVLTPRRSSRLQHTPKMSERKKALFQGEQRESLMRHRLVVVESESDPEDCALGGLGIISAIDSSSSSDEYDQNVPKTPKRPSWYETRNHTKKLLKENDNLKDFIRSPFTLNKYQTKHTNQGYHSTPATPHFHNHPDTPSSSRSCASGHTSCSENSRARKSLVTLIADTESCSSSLKDLNFDSDSDTDSKENTPAKQNVRKSIRNRKMTPKFASFKGVLLEQKKNFISPNRTEIEVNMSPSKMHKTPHTNSEIVASSPPKISHRKQIIEIGESPEPLSDNDKSYKRLRSDGESDGGPNAKYTKFDTSGVAPKARLSLFSSDVKEISVKTFYGKNTPDPNTSFTTKISSAIIANSNQPRRQFGHSHTYRKKHSRQVGQINLGVKHRIRKPKIHNKNKVVYLSGYPSSKPSIGSEGRTLNDSSVTSQTSPRANNDNEKVDPFDKEKRTIDILLSQWTEEDIPESELSYKHSEELPCFNDSVMEVSNPIFNPATAMPVNPSSVEKPDDSEAVIIELGQKSQSNKNEISEESSDRKDTMDVDNLHIANHGLPPDAGNVLPVEGGYIIVNENGTTVQEELPDLDAIERELQMLDEQILNMARSNNIDARVVLASTDTPTHATTDLETQSPVSNRNDNNPAKQLFPIFDKSNTPSGSIPKSTKGQQIKNVKKTILKDGSDQYVIDAGQKRFGATQCAECGVIYQIGDPQDEHDHNMHHYASDVLKYNGSREDTVCGVWGGARVVRVRGGRPGWRKVHQLLQDLIHPYLGYVGDLPHKEHIYTAYLYVEKKSIFGCAIVEPKTEAHRLIPGDPDCCSAETYPVHCGVSRLWTHVSHRRRGVARRLVDCARASFLHGRPLHAHEVAFSAPTQLGKQFAAKYTGTHNFYVYMD